MKHIYARFVKERYAWLRELGLKFNLRFSGHLAVGNKFIALDEIKKSLLVSETGNELNQPYIIDLSEVTGVSVKKSYDSIGSGELRTKKIEDFLRRIDLLFGCYDKDKSVVFTFYNRETDGSQDLRGLEKSIKKWQMILSRLLVPQTGK